ncbi:MAG: deoxyuridine 5'-triphosphate nucleotidohydrolase [Lachnospiraceae bacterium]
MQKVAKFEKVSFDEFEKAFRDVCYMNTNEGTDINFPYLIENKFIEQDGYEKPSEKTIVNAIKKIYDSIHLPKRATTGSAGYDFFMPYPLWFSINTTIKIPTGIKCRMEEGWVLQIYPRSSYGFKYGIELSNTVGIIDKDYYNNENNEGHIFVKLVNKDDTLNGKNDIVILKQGEAFCQGILTPFGITMDDDTDGIRKGGFGSTGKV